MTIRDKVNEFINKPFDEYNLYDVVELSKLKLKVGQLAMEARAAANTADSRYRTRRSRCYIENKASKCTDKMAQENAFIETDKDRTAVDLAKYNAELHTAYHKDLNDVVVAVRMCARIYDAALNDKLEH